MAAAETVVFKNIVWEFPAGRAARYAEVNAVSGVRFHTDGANARFGSKADVHLRHHFGWPTAK
jgi:hypothetical protein